MENYEVISIAGEGSYGIVMKCREKYSQRFVAIKKLLDFESDSYVKKMALREIRILKKLKHENLVKFIEIFRRRKRFYLVFEYLDKTVLDDLEENPAGLGEQRTKEYIFQLLRAIEYCHSKNVIHRDVKPENLLISKSGILKLCDFGFARFIDKSSNNGCYTEYIATRWYRAPELLVKDKKYGKPVDVWAIGCVFAELLSGEPLFPGDSDIDQLHLIMKQFGKLNSSHETLMVKLNQQLIFLDEDKESLINNFNLDYIHSLQRTFSSWPTITLNIMASCLILDPIKRLTATQLLNHEYFMKNNFKECMMSRFRRFSKSINHEIIGSYSTPRISAGKYETGNFSKHTFVTPKISKPASTFPTLTKIRNYSPTLLENCGLSPLTKREENNTEKINSHVNYIPKISIGQFLPST